MFPLFLLLRNQGKEMLFPTNKVLVSKTLSILRVARLVEVVHVQLSDETRKVVVFKIFWQYILGELIGFVHDEAGAI